MTRSFFTDKRTALSGYKARLSGVSLTALALLGVARTASAEEAIVDTVPDGYKLASDLKDFESVNQLDDGSVEIVLKSGETVTIPASDVSMVGGEIFIAEAAAELAGLSFGSGMLTTTTLIAGAAVLGAGGIALASSGESNDAPVLSIPSTVTVSENQASAFTASASDGNGDTLSYSISGSDSGLFSINSSTGVVSFNDAPDFEAPADGNTDNVYTVTVTVSDGAESVSQTVNITVRNENEVPEIAAIEPISAEENQTEVITVSATDVDGDDLAFTLSGADAALFEINATTGLLTFIAAPDFETPADADGDNVYEVTVIASDGTLSASQDVVVTITDVNEAPVVTSGSDFSVAENQTAVFTAAATDVDGDALTFSIRGVDAALFTIDSATGEVAFLEAPDFENPSDAGESNVYDVIIDVTDGAITTSSVVSITVTDENEAPQITTAAAVSVNEGQISAFTATAADVDGDALTYSLSGTDAAAFAINAMTGAVVFTGISDFENPTDANADNVYNVTLSVSDGELTREQAVDVRVLDTDDLRVEGTDFDDVLDASSQTEAAFIDSGLGNDVVRTGEGNDIVSSGAGDDIINPGAGADNVQAGDGNDIVVIIGRTAASEYNAESLVNPAGTGVDVSSVATVADVNANTQDDSNPGEILSGGAGSDTIVVYGETDLSGTNLSSFERLVLNSDVTLSGEQLTAFTSALGIQGDGTSILRIVNTDNVSDVDLDNVSGLAFLEVGAGITLTLSVSELSGLQASGLEAIGGSGRLIISDAAGLDLTGLTITSDLQVVDGATNAPLDPATLGAVITVDNIDPVILQTESNFEFAENGITAAYTASAIAADNGALTYSLSGTDAPLFSIDAVTGEVTFLSVPDFESAVDADADNIYDLVVTASDGVDSSDQSISITVTDENEAPEIGAGVDLNAAENQAAVFTATASDVDGDTLTYSLSGADAAFFAVDASTGVVTFVNLPDFETPADANGDNIYDLTVTANDGSLSASQDVSVSVTDINEAPVVTSGPSVAAEENQTAVFTATASDIDGDALTYSLSGADAGLFEIDASTGVVTFLEAPDFETPSDANADNVYDLTVTASDGALSASQEVSVAVTDVNEAPVVTSGPTVATAENQVVVFTATASDVDNDTLTYSLSGADAALFAVDASTGVVTFIDAPDFETPTDTNGDNIYDVTVVANDGALSTSQDVAITITDINEAPVFVGEPSFMAAENQTAAFTTTASDVDGDTLTYSISGADAALFAVDAATGAVTFIDAPDFELPSDADADNVYDLTLSASDGELSTSQDVSVTVTDVDDTAPDAPVILSVGVVNQFVPNADGNGGVFQFLPAITGTAEAGSTVEIFDGTISLGTTTAQSDGSFFFATALTSVSGELLAATATDAAGNVSDTGVLSSLYGFNPSGYFAENSAPQVTVEDIGVADGFLITDSSGLLLSPDVSNAGDLNNDGFDDIIISSSSYNVNGDFSGQAAVIFGGEDGFGEIVDGQAVIDLANLLPEDGFLIAGEGENDFLRAVSSVGDFNGDGIDDILLGAAGSGLASPGEGASYLIFGSEDAFGETDVTGRQVLELANLTAESGIVFIPGSGEPGSFGGTESGTTAGDINGDGFNDLVFGDQSFSDSGSAFVVYGTEDVIGEIGMDGRQVVTVSTLTPDQGFTITNDDGLAFIGYRVNSVGDVNNDGLDDFAVNALIYTDDLSPFLQGSSFIVFGSEDLLGTENADGVAVLNLSEFSGADGIRVIGSDPEITADAVSMSSIGDFNGDGYEDLLIGSPDFYENFNTPNTGEAYIVFGSENGIGTDYGNGNLILDLSALTADTGIVLTGRSGDRTGFYSTGIDDFNGDGFTDVIVGSAGTNNDGSPGSAFIVYGGSDVGAINDNNQRIVDLPDLSALEGFEFRGLQDFDNVGFAISTAGDVNNDGSPDIIINTLDTVAGPASAVVIFGGSTGVGESETLALVQENTTAAFVATSLGEGTVYTLGGDDAALFEINQETGLVSFIDAPDFEAILSNERFAEILNNLDDPEDLEDFGFDLEILAVNGDVSAVQEVAITITDVNEFAPEFTVDQNLVSSNGRYFILAEDADGTPIALADVREDGSLLFDDALTYEITGGADADLFEIELRDGGSGFTGRLTLIDAPSVDAPTDTNGDGVYVVEISVSDGELVTAQTFNLSVVEGGTDPVVTSPADFVVDELSSPFVGQISGFDPDGAGVNYFLSFTSPDREFFELNFFTGELTFLGNTSPSFSNPFDQDGNNVYELNVIIADGADSTLQTVTVSVNDIDFAPTLVTGFRDEFFENGPIFLSQFSSFGGLTAQDLDFDDITASITGGADAALFTLVESSFDFGEFQGFDLTTTEIFDFENPIDADGDNVYEVEVTFSDGVNETVETLEFTILDIFESPNAPVFTTGDTFTVNEAETFVANVNADDADGETPTYFLQGEDAFAFDLDQFTGELSFASPVRFNQPDNFDDNTYTIEIVADDGSSNQTVQTITVNVEDIDVAPRFNLNTPRTINENEEGSFYFSAFESFDGQLITLNLQGGDIAAFALTSVYESNGFSQAFIEFQPADFENPTDGDGDNVYTVDVVASDGVNTVIETFTLTVLDVFESENAPVITSPASFVVDEGQDFIALPTATDADNEVPTFSVSGGEDQFRFFIDTETGELRFSNPPQFNQPSDFNDNFYEVEITADDGSGNETTQLITVEVIDVNVAPEISIFSADISVMETDVFFASVRANDFFDDEVVTISLGGPDAAAFMLTTRFEGISSRSNLEFVTQPDFEIPMDANGDNVYEIEIFASDGVNISSEIVTITVEDVFESSNAPIFTSPDTVNVDEGIQFIQTVVADDADGETPIYSIVGGEDSFRFTIDSATGDLSFRDGRLPVAFDGGSPYTVLIAADDGTTNVTNQLISVSIVDVDVPPQLNVRDAINIFENTNLGFLGEFTGSDSFDFFTQTVSLFIEGPDADLFTFETAIFGGGSVRGRLSFNELPDFETPLDANGDNVYEVEVFASDGVTTVSEIVTITVEDVFESPNAPIFTSPSSIIASEGRSGTFVANVTATDADGENPTFSITGGPDGFRFDIDSQTGELSLGRQTIFDQFDPDNNVFVIEVTADDGTSNAVTQTINVEIQDIDVVPEFFFLPSDITINENTNFSRSIRGVDRFDGQEITLTLGGVDGAVFQLANSFSAIGQASGSLELIVPLDFENPLDADGDNIYEVEITLSDGVNFVTEIISISIRDVFESPNAPVFTSSDTVSVDEGQNSVILLAADDADGETVFFSVTGGDDRGHFSVDQDGQLSFVNVGNSSTGFGRPIFSDPDDANGDNVYEVEVTASDGTGNNTIQQLSITVEDVNVAPVFFTISDEISVNENTTSNLFSPGAIDPFDGDTVTLALAGIDADTFTLTLNEFDPNFGRVSFTDPPDFELPTDSDGDNVYEIDIVASDGVNSVTQTFIVTVEDVFESLNAPIFTTPDTFTFSEGESFEVTILASDADGETPTYSITGGSIPFASIDATTGVIGPLVLNFDEIGDVSDNTYTIEVTADDGSQNQTVQTITINVEDADVAPTISLSGNLGPGMFTLNENTPFLTLIQGNDNFDDQILTISLAGEDADLFTFETNFSEPGQAFGLLTLDNQLDFENPTDADGDNVYVLDVIVTDGVNDTIQQITITAQDIFESANAPVFVSPDTVSVDQGQGSVLFVSATDADGESPTYSIIGGDDQFVFQINSTTGELTIPTFFGPLPSSSSGNNFYEVEVSADDGSSNVTSQLITVEIIDIDVPPTLNVFGSNDNTISENSPFFLFFFAEDVYEGQNVDITLGGQDADAFVFNQFFGVTFEGSLELELFLDFENPTDSDGDNVYVVDVIASDGVNETIETIAVTVTDILEVGSPPEFTSPSEVSIDEGELLAVSLAATDEDGDVITFSIVGGDDQFDFIIGGPDNTELSFFSATDQNFDFNGDGVFEVDIAADDGNNNVVVQTFFITVNDDTDATVKVVDGETDETVQDPSDMSVEDLIAELTDLDGGLWTPDEAIASFDVDNDGLIDLNEMAREAVSVSDIGNTNFVPETAVYIEDSADSLTAQSDTVALEMQFAADLLMLQESATDVDG